MKYLPLLIAFEAYEVFAQNLEVDRKNLSKYFQNF